MNGHQYFWVVCIWWNGFLSCHLEPALIFFECITFISALQLALSCVLPSSEPHPRVTCIHLLGSYSKISRLGGLNTDSYCLTVLELEVQNQNIHRLDLSWSLPAWLAGGRLLLVSSPAFFLCMPMPQTPLFMRTPLIFDHSPTLMTLFKLNYLFKVPIPKYLHAEGCGFNLRFWGGHSAIHNVTHLTLNHILSVSLKTVTKPTWCLLVYIYPNMSQFTCIKLASKNNGCIWWK